MLGRPLRDKPPRTASGKSLKVFYVAQTGAAPPTFTLVANRVEALHFSETRRIENIVREAADFGGSPIRISIRGRAQTPVARRRSGTGEKRFKRQSPTSKVGAERKKSQSRARKKK